MTTPQISLTSGRSWGRAPASPQSPGNEPAFSAISEHSESETTSGNIFENNLNMHGEKSFNLNMCWWKLLMLKSK